MTTIGDPSVAKVVADNVKETYGSYSTDSPASGNLYELTPLVTHGVVYTEDALVSGTTEIHDVLLTTAVVDEVVKMVTADPTESCTVCGTRGKLHTSSIGEAVVAEVVTEKVKEVTKDRGTPSDLLATVYLDV